MVAAGLALGVWQPWEPTNKVRLPAHACWGALTDDELRPLAGKNGTMVVDTTPSTLQPDPHATEYGYTCLMSWQQTGKDSYLPAVGPNINLYTADNLSSSQRVDASLGKVQSLPFGDGNIAWEHAGTGYQLNLAVPCAFRAPTTGQMVNGYARVSMVMTYAVGHPVPPSNIRQAEAGMVLKVAKAFAQQYPCANVTLPASPPDIPAFPGE